MAPGAMGRHLVYLAQCCGYDILKTLKRLDFTRRGYGGRTGGGVFGVTPFEPFGSDA